MCCSLFTVHILLCLECELWEVHCVGCVPFVWVTRGKYQGRNALCSWSKCSKLRRLRLNGSSYLFRKFDE